jgi:hypothetical protein
VSSVAALAVLIRQAQWLLDDVAANIQSGRVTPEQGRDLASILERLAEVVRDQTAEPMVIEQPLRQSDGCG